MLLGYCSIKIIRLIKIIKLIVTVIEYFAPPDYDPNCLFSVFLSVSLETSKKRSWSLAEVHAVEKTLKCGKVPGKSECVACIKASPEALTK